MQEKEIDKMLMYNCLSCYEVQNGAYKDRNPCFRHAKMTERK